MDNHSPQHISIQNQSQSYFKPGRGPTAQNKRGFAEIPEVREGVSPPMTAMGSGTMTWNERQLREHVLNHQQLEHEAGGVPTGQSTNNWAHLMPSGGLPDQIHPNNFRLGEGGVVTVGPIDSITSGQQLCSEGFQHHLLSQEDEKHATSNSFTTHGMQNQSSLFQHLDPSKTGNLAAGDSKNLRNFFIQSSLTFNGNNLGSNQKRRSNGSHRADLKLEVNQSQLEEEHDQSILEENQSVSDEQRVVRHLNRSS